MFDMERRGIGDIDGSKKFDDFDAESQAVHEAVDTLIDLQRQAFIADLGKQDKRLGAIYLRMAEIEGSIHNFGEAAAYAFDAVEAFERVGRYDEAIAGWCVVAKTRCKLGLPEEGYAALFRGIEIRKQLTADALAEAAKEEDDVVVARNIPIKHFPPTDEGTENDGESIPKDARNDLVLEAALAQMSMNVLSDLLLDKHEAFQEWLAEEGTTCVATRLRKLEAAKASGDHMIPLIPLMHDLIANNTLPKAMHSRVLGDLDGIFEFGPYSDSIYIERSMRLLGETYRLFAAQSGLKREQRKAAEQRATDILYAHSSCYSGPQFSGYRTVPHPVDNIKSLVEQRKKRFSY